MYNWNVAGHKNAQKFLENSIDKGKIANAYLFYGPRRVGKTLIAENFTKSLFCVNNDKTACLSAPCILSAPCLRRQEAGHRQDAGAGRPCGKCVSCAQIEKGVHPDVFRISKLEDKNNISIEQTREMKEKFYSSSFFSSYKVGIVKEAEFLNSNGWNSLLKILEEPPSKTVIIIIANNIYSIPATIISRCQKIKFSYVSEDIIIDYLNKLGAQRFQSREIARLAQGKPGLAKEIFTDSLWMDTYNEEISQCLSFFDSKNNLKEKNDLIAKIVKEKNDIHKFFDFLTVLLRDFILIQTNPDMVVNLGYSEKLKIIGKRFSVKKVVELLEKNLKLKNYLVSNVSGKLLLENFVLEID